MRKGSDDTGCFVSCTGAPVLFIEPLSPADDAGFQPGFCITHVDENPLRDIIDWQWYSAADEIELAFCDPEGEAGTVVLQRDPGEFWGFVFEGIIFDGVRACKNACTFCFMHQLPQGMRPSLSFRDDDFRMSFLQGTFITCTNIDTQDEVRIIEQHISPLRVSFHAVSPSVRSDLIGKNCHHGLEVIERLLDAGIQMHMQIVLVPGVNDGEELRLSLEWLYGQPGVLNVGIVPLGFTDYQNRFDESYEDALDAGRVIADIKPFQERALCERSTAWVFAADEFYCNAYGKDLLAHIPENSFFGDYDLFEDGIGMIRSYMDSWEASSVSIAALAQQLAVAKQQVLYVAGFAQENFFAPLVSKSPLAGLLIPFFVKNHFFGGNVDVTGLLTAKDILAALNDESNEGKKVVLAVIPQVIFNAEGLTLDDMSLEDIQSATHVSLAVVSCNPAEYVEEIAALLA